MKALIIPILLAAALCVLCKTTPAVNKGYVDDPVAYVPELTADHPDFPNAAIGFVEDFDLSLVADSEISKAIPPSYAVSIMDAGFTYNPRIAEPIDVGIAGEIAGQASHGANAETVFLNT